MIPVMRHWDSLEEEEGSPKRRVPSSRPLSPLSVPSTYHHVVSPSPAPRPRLPDVTLHWLRELRLAVEHECMSILYAKSLLEECPPPVPGHSSNAVLRRQHSTAVPPRPLSICIGMSAEGLSSSLGRLDEAPPKPRRCIARMMSTRQSRTVASVCTPMVREESVIDASSPNPTAYTSIRGRFCSEEPAEHRPFSTVVSYTHNVSRNPFSHIRYEGPPTAGTERRRLPSYDQVRPSIPPPKAGLEVRGGEARSRLTHSIAVNEERDEREEDTFPSPKSVETMSTASMDSGQCSGEPVFSSQHSFSSEREASSESLLLFHQCRRRPLPAYPRMASTMDHVLRTSSSIYALLARASTAALAAKTLVFIQMVEASPIGPLMPKQDIKAVLEVATEAQSSSRPTISDYGLVLIRKLVECALQFFVRIIARYLSEASNKDRLLAVALQHLVHLCLFGDELCIHAIQYGSVDHVLKLARQPSSPLESRRLLIRVLAVLCGTSKGCLQLLALGGLSVVLSSLSSPCTLVSIEAAGLLTQLTNPTCCYVHMDNVEAVIGRLLAMIDDCESSESLLLCSAALANVSQQEASFLYQHNAVRRLIVAYRKKNCSSIFVQEQMVTMFSRMAARKYEEALIAQGAVPILLEMMTATDSQHGEYCRRIRYKAAVCAGTLAATGIGLKALHANHAYAIINNVLEMDNSPSSTLNMICSNIKTKLETKYQVESAV